VLVFAALGLGLALPFVVIAFVPALRRLLPRPGSWMARLQRFLAIPMAATAVGCLWLLWRQGGAGALGTGFAAAAALVLILLWVGRNQRRGGQGGLAALAAVLAVTAAATLFVPARSASVSRVPLGAVAWSEAAVARERAAGHPVFAYFTADWCLTCKVNEASAIERDETQAALRKAGVKVLVGDWTNGDPAITRFLDRRARAGVPLYLWYEPGAGEAEELPQVLTPGMLVERARRRR
jgi:thiol:disulfide interchange protein